MDQIIYKRSFVVSMLNLIVGFIFVISAFSSLSFLIGMLFGFWDSEINDWPVTINMIAKNLVVMEEMIKPIEFLSSGNIMINGGELSFSSAEWPFYSVVGPTFKLLNIILILAFLYNFWYIIASVEYGQPFTLINYKRLKFLAILLVVFFFYGVIYSAVHHWYIINYVELASGEFISKVFHVLIPLRIHQLSADQILLENQHSLRPLIAAIFIYSLAIVYKEGFLLKHDSDSIV